jgi:hypothetical protein
MFDMVLLLVVVALVPVLMVKNPAPPQQRSGYPFCTG